MRNAIWRAAEAIDTETAASERLRARLLGLIFLVAALGFALFTTLFPDMLVAVPADSATRLHLLLLMLFATVYEFGVSYIFGLLERRGTRVPLPMRIGNATVEISIPTFGIMLLSEAVHPMYALLSPFVAVYFIFIMVSTLRLSFGLSLYSGALAAAQYLALVLYWLRYSDLSVVDPLFASPWLYVSRVVLLLLAGLAAALITQRIHARISSMLRTAEEKRDVIQLFGQQVSEPVVKELLDHPDYASGVTRRVSVLFLDIRNFTPFVGSRKPEEVVGYLNTMFGALIPIVEANGGIVNQFLGDGFMATFGAPVAEEHHATRAVEAALAMYSAVQHLNDDGVIPRTRIGIGVHSGEAVTGNIGAGARRQYSVTGNAVILASRIEQLNKVYNTSVLISGITWSELDHSSLFTESLGTVILKGCSDPVVIYKLA